MTPIPAPTRRTGPDAGHTKSPWTAVTRIRSPGVAAASARLNEEPGSGCRVATTTSDPGVDTTLSMRRRPRVSTRPCGTSSSTYWPGRNRSGRSAAKTYSTTSSPRRRRSRRVRVREPCRSAKATSPVTTSVSSYVLVKGSVVHGSPKIREVSRGHVKRKPARAATPSCCSRRGGRVSGSLSMRRSPPASPRRRSARRICSPRCAARGDARWRRAPPIRSPRRTPTRASTRPSWRRPAMRRSSGSGRCSSRSPAPI